MQSKAESFSLIRNIIKAKQIKIKEKIRLKMHTNTIVIQDVLQVLSHK